MLTVPEITVIAFDEVLVHETKKLLEKMKRQKIKVIFNNDTTFNLTGYYVTILSFQHPMLEKDEKPGVSPVIPLGYLFHEKKNNDAHSYFWQWIAKVCIFTII